MATQIICSESALIMRVVSLWWIQSHVYGIWTGAVPRWIFNCKTEAQGFAFKPSPTSICGRSTKEGQSPIKTSNILPLCEADSVYRVWTFITMVTNERFNVTFLVIPWNTYVRFNCLIHLILRKAFYKLLESWLIVLTWYRIRCWRCWWSMVTTTLWW